MAGAAKRKSSTNRAAIIALDLGGTKLASAIFTPTGRPLAKSYTELNARQGADVGELVVETVQRLATIAAKRALNLRAIGVSVPGIVKPRTARIWAPNIPGWDDYPLAEALRKAMPRSKLSVAIESDRAASMLGEVWRGAARNCRNAVFLAVGTGIGAGLLIDGKVVAGANGSAGAIGWWGLDRPFRPEYKTRGCFESHASGHGIGAVAKAALNERQRYRGQLPREELTAHDVFTAYASGDTLAEDTIATAIEFWGLACANLVSLLNPEKIIFGGGVFGPATQFIDEITREAERWAQPIAMQQVRLEASKLGPEAALYGAAYLALERSRLFNAAQWPKELNDETR